MDYFNAIISINIVCIFGLFFLSTPVIAETCLQNINWSSAQKTPGDNGFSVKLTGNPPPQRYTPGQVYTGNQITNVILINFRV